MQIIITTLDRPDKLLLNKLVNLDYRYGMFGKLSAKFEMTNLKKNKDLFISALS